MDKEHQNEIEKKKNRLKQQLSVEHKNDWNTFKEWNKIKSQEDIQIRHDRLIARKADREHQRQKFVEAKNMQKLLYEGPLFN